MVGDRALAVGHHDADLRDAGPRHLLDRVLDDRTVDHGEQHLRHRLGGGKEAGSETSSGDDALANGHDRDNLTRRRDLPDTGSGWAPKTTSLRRARRPELPGALVARLEDDGAGK